MQSPHWSQGTETADTTCALSGPLKLGFACAGLLCIPDMSAGAGYVNGTAVAIVVTGSGLL